MPRRYFLIACILALLTGCSHGSSDTSTLTGPYADFFRAAERQATSAFEQQVLADGRITRSEYLESVQKYVGCVNAHGLQMSNEVGPDGTMQYSFPGPPVTDAQNAMIQECTRGSTQVIEPLYYRVAQNPKNVDIYKVMADCLVAKGKAPAGFTGAELKVLLTGPDGLDAKGSPIDGSDPVVVACQQPPYS